jgi:hypothetical protein
MKRLLAALSMSGLMLIPLAAQADIEGFSVNGIAGKDALTLDARFGTSSSSTEHKVNYLDCLLYNGETTEETTTETTSAALEGEGDASSSPDAGDAGDAGDASDASSGDVTDAQSGSDTTGVMMAASPSTWPIGRMAQTGAPTPQVRPSARAGR